MSTNRDIFLTGATGLIGRNLRQRLFSEGYDVETNFRYFNSKKWLAVIHLAAVTHTKTEFDPELIEANYILTNKIFQTSAPIIYASSCSAGYDTNPYAQSKMYAEHLGAIQGNALGLRFFNVYGYGNNKGIIKYIMDAPNGVKLIVRGPDIIRDYLHVSDAVDQIVFHIKQNYFKGILDIGTKVGTSTLSLVNKYMELSGKEFKIETIPAGEHEPKVMISRSDCCKITLEEGLKQLIKSQ